MQGIMKNSWNVIWIVLWFGFIYYIMSEYTRVFMI
jgi:hypothetical protein